MTGGQIIFLVIVVLVVVVLVALVRARSRSAPLTSNAATAGGDSGARTFTHLLQVNTIDGNWGNLREPQSGTTLGFGTVTVPVADLPQAATRIMKEFEGISLKKRVVFFDGARTDRKLMHDDAYGMVVEGSDVLVPGTS